MTAARRPTGTDSAAPSRGPRLRLVKRPDAKASTRSTAGTFGTAVIVIVMLLAFGAVAAQTLLIQQRLHIDETNKMAEAARGEQAVLQLEVASLEAPARILAEAQARLGMIPPADRRFLASAVPGDLRSPLDPPTPGVFAGSATNQEAGDSSTGVAVEQ